MGQTLRYLQTVVHVKERRREIWPIAAQGVLKNVGDCEDHGEGNTQAGEHVLQGRVLASQVRVIDVNEPFCGKEKDAIAIRILRILR